MATGGAITEAAPETSPPPYTQIFMPPSNLPPLKVLVLDDNVATNWKAWKKVWSRYEIATGISKQESLVRVSTFLSVIGKDTTKAYDAFEWGEAEDETNIEHVLAKFDAYCEPRTQVIYERYRFNNRKQEPGKNIVAYLTELRTIAKNCQQEEITPEEILRDRIVLGIRDDKMCERLLRYNDLTLQKAGSKSSRSSMPSRSTCRRRGTSHAKKKCPAFGQKCHQCGYMNHYQSLCRRKTVASVHIDDGTDQYEISTVGEQPSCANKALVNL